MICKNFINDMAFVYLSLDDLHIFTEMTRLRAIYNNETIYKLEAKPNPPNESKILNEKIPEFHFDNIKEGETVTFYGHGISTERPGYFLYGQINLTPENFAKLLIERGLPKNRPINLEFLGCEIGLFTNNNSFVHQVAEHLYQQGYHHVQIKALTSLVSEQEFESMILVSRELISQARVVQLEWHLYGTSLGHYESLEKKAENIFPKTAEQIKRLNEQINNLKSKLKIIQKESAESKDSQRINVLKGQVVILNATIQRLKTQRFYLSKKIEDKKYNLLYKTAKPFLKIHDLRVSLNKRNNLINFDLHETFKKISVVKRKTIYQLNNQLDRLDELYQQKESAYIKYFAKKSQAKYREQQAILQNLIDVIKKNDEQVIQAELEKAIDIFKRNLKDKEILILLQKLNQNILKDTAEFKESTKEILESLNISELIHTEAETKSETPMTQMKNSISKEQPENSKGVKSKLIR